MPALCPNCKRLSWEEPLRCRSGQAPQCRRCDLVLLPRTHEQLFTALLSTEETAERAVDLALVHIQLGNNDNARSSLEAALYHWPGSGRLHLVLALVLARLGMGVQAYIHLTRATRLDPEHCTFANATDQIARRMARDQLAALEASDADGKELGRFRAMCGNWTGALDAYASALTHNPHDAELLTLIGVASRLLGKLNEAVELHQRAIELDHNLAVAHGNLATALSELDALELAHRSALDAVALDSTLGHPWISLAVANLRASRVREARDALERATRATPDLDPEAIALSALAALDDEPARSLELIASVDDHRRAHQVPQLQLARWLLHTRMDQHRAAADTWQILWQLATESR